MRVVVDPNVIIAALLSPGGGPAQIMRRWLTAEFELVVSEALLDELERALAYPRLRRRIAREEARELVSLLREGAVLASDPDSGRYRSADPGDDYLLALAERERAVLVSGDRHLLDLAGELPIESPRTFLGRLGEG